MSVRSRLAITGVALLGFNVLLLANKTETGEYTDPGLLAAVCLAAAVGVYFTYVRRQNSIYETVRNAAEPSYASDGDTVAVSGQISADNTLDETPTNTEGTVIAPWKVKDGLTAQRIPSKKGIRMGYTTVPFEVGDAEVDLPREKVFTHRKAQRQWRDTFSFFHFRGTISDQTLFLNSPRERCNYDNGENISGTDAQLPEQPPNEYKLSCWPFTTGETVTIIGEYRDVGFNSHRVEQNDDGYSVVSAIPRAELEKKLEDSVQFARGVAILFVGTAVFNLLLDTVFTGVLNLIIEIFSTTV